MKEKIYYNEFEDEFTYDLSLEGRLNRYVNDKFYPAIVIANLANVYLLGGAIRDLMYAKNPKDLDFVVLDTNNLNWILEVFKKFDIKYTYNHFGGFRINYNGIKIDLWCSNDLYSAMEYNVDGLFYEIKTKTLISFTFDDFKNRGIRLINNENNREKGRIKKLNEFYERYSNN